MSALEDTTREHYGALGLAQRLDVAVAGLRATREMLTPDDLAGLDQLHTGGADATRALIRRLAPARGMHVLDVGCGLGGPARMLAAISGVRVTGVDLTPEFVAAAQRLTAETGQTGEVDFQCASALALPVATASFDAGWHIHMSMNIADKAQLYGEIFRVLKPGARFALHDPIRGRRGDVVFPVPWAASAENSYLCPEEQLKALVSGAGFEITHTFDATADGIAWFEQLAATEAAQTPEARARAVARSDPRFAVMSANHRLNLESGAVEILGLVARKPQ